MARGVVEEFEAQRPRMFGLAYRLLGSAVEAEDVVQEAFLRWHQAAHETIREESSWLAKVVTNLSLNRLSSAQMRRERYVGSWLPEPVLTSNGALGPLESVQLRESVSMAVLVLLEKLSPVERAVFVLREAFDYSHRDIATILDVSEANSRQLLSRAKDRLAAQAPPPKATDPARWQALVLRFLAAAQEGDLAALESMLADDVTSWTDGGGRVSAALRPIFGRDRVARYVVGTLERFGQGYDVSFAEVNGEAAILASLGGVVGGVAMVEFVGEKVTAMRTVMNPEKLAFLAEQLSHSAGLSGS